MSKIVLTGTVVLSGGQAPLTPGYVVVNGPVLAHVGPTLPAEYANWPVHTAAYITPGFVDIHNHGLGGCRNVLAYWLHDETVTRLPKYGTTSVLASITFPKSHPSLHGAVADAIQQRMDAPLKGCARIRGIHAEGPIIQTCGGLPDSERDMSLSEFEALLSSTPAMKLMTISPSLEKARNYNRIKALLAHNITPCLGHDVQADEDSILNCLRLAFESKRRLHITHMFNASAFHHRNIELPTVEVIGDLVHVHPLALKTAIDTRGGSATAIVTDCIMDAADTGQERDYAGKTISVAPVPSEGAPRGKVVIKGSGVIAGSCTNLLRVFQDLIKVMKVPIAQAVQMVAETPAIIAGLEKSVGALAEGREADVLLFDSNYNLNKVFVGGDEANL